MILIVALFSFLLGCSLLGAILSFFYHIEYLMWQIWCGAALLSAIGVALSLSLVLRKGKTKESHVQEKLERFEKEYKQVLRGHLKVSILFWTFFYKRKKVKSFDDAKREVFQDLKKEFPHLKWLESLLEEIRQDLIRYK
jgi:hypothetical protein